MVWNSLVVTFIPLFLFTPTFRVILLIEKEHHIHKNEENCVFTWKPCDVDNCGNEGNRDRAIKLQA